MITRFQTVRFLLLTCVLLSGCATAPFEDAQRQFRRGDAEAALTSLDNTENHSSRSELLLQMERGLVLHHMAEYEKSTKAFLLAESIMQSQDYISLSEQATTLIVNDTLADYRGEYNEQLLVHSYQMMNYLLLDQYDSAAVEARQALEVLAKHGKPLARDWFTHALIGLSFESVGKINDAYIEYKKLAEKMPDERPIAQQLYWFAKRLGLSEAAEQYRPLLTDSSSNVAFNKLSSSNKTVSQSSAKQKSITKLAPDEYGELILFVANGNIPRKVSGNIFLPPDIRISFPRYAGYASPAPAFNVTTSRVGEVQANERLHDAYFTAVTTPVAVVARESLDARGAAVLLKLSARLITKHAIVNSLGDRDEAAAQLLNILFFIIEEADTRGWATLPANLTLLRIPLAAGTHNIAINTSDAYTGSLPSGNRVFSIENFKIAEGQRIYRKIRF